MTETSTSWPDLISAVATAFAAVAAVGAAVAAWRSASSAQKSAEAAATANRIEIARETREIYDVLQGIIVDFTCSPGSIDRSRNIQLHTCVEKRKVYLNNELYALLRSIIKAFDEANMGEFQESFWTSEKISDTRYQLNKARDMLKDPASLP